VQVCFSVTENTHMSVVGDGVFKMYRYSDGSLRQFAMQKADFPHFVSHAWLTNDLVLAGTTNGRLIVIDSTEYKREYVVFPDNQPDMRYIQINFLTLPLTHSVGRVTKEDRTLLVSSFLQKLPKTAPNFKPCITPVVINICALNDV